MSNKRRVLLKLSGEALAGEKGNGFDEEVIRRIGEQIKKATSEGIELAIVIGGGNFYRGLNSDSVERTKGDQIGMLATAMNCLFVSSLFTNMGMKTAVFSSFEIGGAIPLFSFDEVEKAFAEGKIVFFAGGTGHPYFSTDTGVVLRAVEMHADEILMAKNIDGVYDSDPASNPSAKKFDKISIGEMVEKRLHVIDLTASTILLENPIPMILFGLDGENSIYNAMKGETPGTRVTL